MKEKICCQCTHFLQHYGLQNHKLYKLYCGHCTAVSAKHKHPDAKACAHYAPKPENDEDFVTKEYLSRRLLEHVLQMELLPEILHCDPSVK